ncbi:MAG: hypothetical protein GY711_26090 [bacterium]|nr:hypothetical protein [bacterium]
MPHQAALPFAVSLALLAPGAFAQGFNYPDFSSVAGLAFNNDAAQAGNVLRVTAAAGDQHGSVWYDQRVSVAGGFETTFRFRIDNLANDGADGMAFVIQDDPRGVTAIGDLAFGTPLCYGADAGSPSGTAIANSLAIEIDTWMSAPANDTSANEISIHTVGPADNEEDESFSIGRITPATILSDGVMHTMRITQGAGMLSVYLDDLTNPIISVPYDLAGGGTYLTGGPAPGLNLTGGAAYVGFTSATGGAWENHDVLAWSFDPGELGTNYCGPALINSTGLPAEISASGSSSAAANDVMLTASQLPAGQFGYFLAGQTQGFFNPPGSQGIICITGNIGRYNQIANIIQGPTGTIALNLMAIPVNPPVAVQPGDTWNFQCWFRDNNPTLTSNFTDGVEVTFL